MGVLLLHGCYDPNAKYEAAVRCAAVSRLVYQWSSPKPDPRYPPAPPDEQVIWWTSRAESEGSKLEAGTARKEQHTVDREINELALKLAVETKAQRGYISADYETCGDKFAQAQRM